MSEQRPDVIIIMSDEERAAPPYESDDVAAWRGRALPGAQWFDDNAVAFRRHYTGSLACVPSRPTIFTGHYPEVHGVTQTDCGCPILCREPVTRGFASGSLVGAGPWVPCTWGMCRPSDTNCVFPGQSVAGESCSRRLDAVRPCDLGFYVGMGVGVDESPPFARGAKVLVSGAFSAGCVAVLTVC